MFRRRNRPEATGEVIAIGQPVIPDLDPRLDEILVRGRHLAHAARGLHTQGEFERWQDALFGWRSAAAETLDEGLTTTAARDELLETWSVSAPLCALWTDELKVQRARLGAALQLVEHIRYATAASAR